MKLYVANIPFFWYICNMKTHKYINNLEKYGTLSFTIQDITKALDKPKVYVYKKILELKKKGVIVSPTQGFYVIVPARHQVLGCLPAKELVVITMRHLDIPYYAGLLTAARYHGATHQGLFAFHVVTKKRMPKEWIIGHVWVKFIHKKDISDVELIKKKTDVGSLLISAPEETAKDVMTYYKQCGGLNHQATVLAELTEAINTKKLISLAKRSGGLFWVQRMGYILENIDTFYEQERDRVVAALEVFLSKKKLLYVPLAPEMPTKKKPRNKKWHIIENSTVESDV